MKKFDSFCLYSICQEVCLCLLKNSQPLLEKGTKINFHCTCQMRDLFSGLKTEKFLTDSRECFIPHIKALSVVELFRKIL